MERIVSWNINGIRAAEKKGLFDFLAAENLDLLALQETKAQPEQLAAPVFNPAGYHRYLASAERKGYSGVAVYTRRKPQAVSLLGIEEFDAEGRVLVLEFPEYSLINAYFPNSQAEGARLDYKIRFCRAIQALCRRLEEEGRSYLLCGDYNVAHRPLDLARPRQNEGNPGYFPEERAWMDDFTAQGAVDIFRRLYPEAVEYTWWSYRFRAREKNIGWRIDYFCSDQALFQRVHDLVIRSDVMGSDHCPLCLSLKPEKA